MRPASRACATDRAVVVLDFLQRDDVGQTEPVDDLGGDRRETGLRIVRVEVLERALKYKRLQAQPLGRRSQFITAVGLPGGSSAQGLLQALGRNGPVPMRRDACEARRAAGDVVPLQDGRHTAYKQRIVVQRDAIEARRPLAAARQQSTEQTPRQCPADSTITG